MAGKSGIAALWFLSAILSATLRPARNIDSEPIRACLTQ